MSENILVRVRWDTENPQMAKQARMYMSAIEGWIADQVQNSTPRKKIELPSNVWLNSDEISQRSIDAFWKTFTDQYAIRHGATHVPVEGLNIVEEWCSVAFRSERIETQFKELLAYLEPIRPFEYDNVNKPIHRPFGEALHSI